MIPIVVRIGMLATSPMMSRMRPRMIIVRLPPSCTPRRVYPPSIRPQTFRSVAQRADGVVDAQRAACRLHVQALHHPAAVGDHARAPAVLPRPDQPAGVLDR